MKISFAVRLMIRLALATTCSWAHAELSPPLTVLIRSATWCGPCQNLEHALVASGIIDQKIETNAAKLGPFTFSGMVNGTPRTIELKIINYDKLSDRHKRDFDEELGKVTGFPEVMVWAGENLHGSRLGSGDSLEALLQVISTIELEAASRSADARSVIDQAVDPKTVDRAAHKISGERALTIVLGASYSAYSNGASIPRTLALAQETLIDNGYLRDNQLVSLYGEGAGKDTPALLRASIWPPWVPWIGARAPKSVDFAARRDQILSVMVAARDEHIQNMFMIVKGHGQMDGLSLWGQTEYSPMDMSMDVKVSGANTVLLNGSCHGGLFQNVNRCGFYAARPELLSTGCGSQEFDLPKDYVQGFMTAVAQPESADLNNDGVITFAEAHARAYNLADGDVPYTDVDALADRMLNADGTKDLFAAPLPTPATDLIRFLNPVEQAMYRRSWHALDLPSDARLTAIELGAVKIENQGYLELRIKQSRLNLKLAPTATTLKFRVGDEPNEHTYDPGTDKAYQVQRLIQLLRRAVLRRALQDEATGFGELSAKLKEIDACEGQSIKEFLH